MYSIYESSIFQPYVYIYTENHSPTDKGNLYLKEKCRL